MTAERERALGRFFFVGLTAAVLCLFLFAWIADEMLEGDTRAFDNLVRQTLYAHASPQMTTVMRVFTMFGSPVVVFTLAALAFALFYRAHWTRAAGLFLITLAGGFVLNLALKLAFHRERPPVTFFGTQLPATYSFPSGHAMFSACFFVILAALISPRLRSAVSRFAIWLAAVVIVAVIGLSRIYLGVHYPSDVIAGYAAAVVWVVTVASADRLLRRRALKESGGRGG